MSDVSLLAFWQFGSGWMLLWGLAAALPILIHLWSRRRYREVTWAAMQFLIAAMRKNSRRILLEQWLLLAVRTLILLLLALALADPSLSLLPAWSGARGGQTHLVLVIDGSYSMDFRSDDKSRFAAAKERAKQRVEAAAQGDGVTLVLMSEPPRVVIGEPAFDAQDVLEELDSLSLVHAGANLTATLAEVETILRAASRQHPRLTQREVCFFTDLGRTTWGHANTADGRERLGRLAELARLSLADVGQPGDQNWAVTGLESSQSLITIASEATFHAEVQSFASEDLRQQPIEMHVDGQQVAEQRLDVAAGGRASATFNYTFSSAGEHAVEVRLADDRLPLDNRRFLAVSVRESIRVLAIDGKPGEAQYVALALQPSDSDRPRVRVERASESALLENDLSGYDCIVLCNVGRISQGEAAVLRQYVAGGGGLITFLGDLVQPDSYNEHLAESVLPARLDSLASESRYRFNPLNYEHPLVAPFRGHERSGLLTTPVWRYFQLDPRPAAKVALAFDGGDPAIVEQQIGRGRSILFASAASAESVDRSTEPPTPWTAIASWPSFPPLVQEMLNLAISGNSAGRNVQVGAELTNDAPTATPDTPLVLAAPDGRSERLTISLAAANPATGLPRWRSNPTTLSGIYEARLGPPVSSTLCFAANVNPRESELERLPVELLPGQIQPAEPGVSAAAAPSSPAGTATTAGHSYFRLLLSLVLALALTETVLAWQFGKGST